jgi:dephospho-CoA kinase
VTRRPVAVAVTGGIAAGKSETLAAFARRGAAVASSDEIVHRLLAEDDEVRAAIRERWGDDAVGDRGRIGAIVFADRDELHWLEQLLHPRTRAAVDAWLEELRARPDPPALAVVEIPLLYETGGESRFDEVVVVTAPAGMRGARRAGIAEREARLIPDDEKLRRADFAYVNDGSLDALDGFVAGVVEELGSAS